LGTADVRVFDGPRERGGDGNDPGAIMGAADIAVYSKILLRADGLDIPKGIGALKDPLRAAQLVNATLLK
jgi:hypothetical protein